MRDRNTMGLPPDMDAAAIADRVAEVLSPPAPTMPAWAAEIMERQARMLEEQTELREQLERQRDRINAAPPKRDGGA